MCGFLLSSATDLIRSAFRRILTGFYSVRGSVHLRWNFPFIRKDLFHSITIIFGIVSTTTLFQNIKDPPGPSGPCVCLLASGGSVTAWFGTSNKEFQVEVQLFPILGATDCSIRNRRTWTSDPGSSSQTWSRKRRHCSSPISCLCYI